uniref:Peptidase C45 hydrolase domain-containing protein n=1 Tax=Lotharella globosa TaxID=91324 RepID=A0A7S3ZCJ4_9EUKA|mmetsp:Transcript_12941/g.24479  ORF Transcript_12941/g.24479 Transcript_12941/m.24479 type:complete len:409 (+) Transcript_12941:40-1266(+)
MGSECSTSQWRWSSAAPWWTRRTPTLTLEGSPDERGKTHGKVFRDRIHSSWEFYHALFRKVGWKDDEIKAAVRAIALCVKQKFPDYHGEIRGIASGSGMEEWQIYALNSRTEILNGRRKSVADDATDGECSSAYGPDSAVLGQNWDWEKTLEDLFVVMRIHYPDGRRVATVTEPGMLAKIGLNNDGVGVLLNLLYFSPVSRNWGGESRTQFTGCIPVHILLRCILDSRSLDEAVRIVQGCPMCVASMSNLFVADDKGRYAMIELGGGEDKVDPIMPPPRTAINKNNDKDNGWCDWERKKDALLPVHTNHFLRCDFQDTKTGNASSHARQRRLLTLVRDAGPNMSADDLKKILGDTEGDLPLLRHYIPNPELGFENAGTCCAVVMELKTRKLHVTAGSPLSYAYQTYSV